MIARSPILVSGGVLCALLLVGVALLLQADHSAREAEVVEVQTRQILDASFEIQSLVPEAIAGSTRAQRMLDLAQHRAAASLAGLRAPLGDSSSLRWLDKDLRAVQRLQARLFARSGVGSEDHVKSRLAVSLYELTATAGTLNADAVARRRQATAVWRWGALTFLLVAAGGLVLLAVQQARADRRAIHHQRELAAAHQHLRAYADDLEQYVYAASHDLKEPLRMVSQFLDLLMLRLGQAPQPIASYLERALAGASHMHRLLDDLLRITILERDAVRHETFAAGVVVDEVVGILDPHLRDVDGKVVIRFLPTVVAERTGFMLVVQNLIANALKYRDRERSPLIIIDVEDTPSEWVFSVTDNGVGFAMTHAEDIFRLFKRLHAADVPGTGAGLAICRKIVARWQGRIWAEAVPGQGSTFRFSIPKPGGP